MATTYSAVSGASPVTLIVEDHCAVRRALRDLMTQFFEDIRFLEAGNVEDALALVEREHVDIALMDICLPDTDGVKGTRRLLERSPDTQVIMVSLFDDATYRYAASAAGARAFISKRAIGRELIPMIERLVARDRRCA